MVGILRGQGYLSFCIFMLSIWTITSINSNDYLPSSFKSCIHPSPIWIKARLFGRPIKSAKPLWVEYILICVTNFWESCSNDSSDDGRVGERAREEASFAYAGCWKKQAIHRCYGNDGIPQYCILTNPNTGLNIRCQWLSNLPTTLLITSTCKK